MVWVVRAGLVDEWLGIFDDSTLGNSALDPAGQRQLLDGRQGPELPGTYLPTPSPAGSDISLRLTDQQQPDNNRISVPSARVNTLEIN